MTSDGTRVVLERGKTWVFASALDHPGWARRGKGDDAALRALSDYEDRYRQAVGDLCPAGAGDRLVVVEEQPGTATTDFGAPDAKAEADREPVDAATAGRLVAVLDACWARLDEVVAAAPAELLKGPRGGGRDRDRIVDHVREAERSYGRTIGVRVRPARRGPSSARRSGRASWTRSTARPGAPAGRCATGSGGPRGTSWTTRGRSRTRCRRPDPPHRWAPAAALAQARPSSARSMRTSATRR